MHRWMALVFVLACGSGEAVSNPDASSDVGADGGMCCAPDPHPACCMNYGGWSSTGQCVGACDGMPQPNDPEWTLTTDSHGCSVWTNPKPMGGYPGNCGTAVIDAGSDTSSD